METIPCPTCGLPRVIEDAPTRPCPVCNRMLTDPPAPPVEAQAAVPESAARLVAPVVEDGGSVRNWLLVGGTVLAGVVVIGLLLWSREWPSFADLSPPPPGPPNSAATEPAPAPRLASLAPPVAILPPELAPLPRELLLPAGPYAVIRLDRPTSDYKLDRLGEGNRLKLVGRVQRLLIEGLEGGAALDASELEVQDVFFYGKVDGGARAVIRSANGAVLFRDQVTGGSRLLILPGTDFVSFASTPTRDKVGSQIAGGARVQITAKAVHFAAPITGPETTVEVTLDRGGSLRFSMVDRAAKLLYKSINPDGPPPRVHFGIVRGGAESKLAQ